MRTELRELEARLDEAADRNWEIREAQERAATFLEAQDDLIGRRDASGAIIYVNDAYCALAARTRAELLATYLQPAGDRPRRYQHHGGRHVIGDAARLRQVLFSLAGNAIARCPGREGRGNGRGARIVPVTPAIRAELAALKEAGFTGYLIKPVRAGSLAARLSTNDGFEAS